jgi:hypothetical protein
VGDDLDDLSIPEPRLPRLRQLAAGAGAAGPDDPPRQREDRPLAPALDCPSRAAAASSGEAPARVASAVCAERQ